MSVSMENRNISNVAHQFLSGSCKPASAILLKAAIVKTDCDIMKMTSRPIMPKSPYLLPKRNSVEKMSIKPYIYRTVNALSASLKRY